MQRGSVGGSALATPWLQHCPGIFDGFRLPSFTTELPEDYLPGILQECAGSLVHRSQLAKGCDLARPGGITAEGAANQHPVIPAEWLRSSVILR